jgi:hypothetical protein
MRESDAWFYVLDGTAHYRLAHSAACFHGNCHIDRFFLQVSPASLDILN